MSKLRVGCFSLSLDGFGAGPGQSHENPLGEGGEALHEWFVPTRTFQRVHGKEGGTTSVDDEFAARVNANIGAWIMGRNMFGPIRGPWRDENWKGWWGDNPPFHGPVFVLTHHEHAPITMAGGTVFHFVTDGIEAALERAVRAANGRMCYSAGEWRLSGNIYAPGLSTRCILRSPRCSLALASISSPILMQPASVIGAPSTFPRKTPPMSC